MFTKNLVAASLVVAVLSAAGCGEIVSDPVRSATTAVGCASHAARYEFRRGEQLSGDPGCFFVPSAGDVILPDSHGSSDCESSLTFLVPMADQRLNVIATADCFWDATADHATCVVEEHVTELGVSCSGSAPVYLDRVAVVNW